MRLPMMTVGRLMVMMGDRQMKCRRAAHRCFPGTLRTYLTFNLVLAVLMAVVMAVRMELKSAAIF